jgi:hypothetical protein
MYATLLFVHSWLRWIVLTLLVVSVVRGFRGGAFTARDARTRTITVASADTQALLGVLLYVVGPMTPRSGAAFALYMKIAVFRFFTLEHPFGMVIALTVLHIFAVRSRKSESDALQHRRWAIGASIALAAVLLSIPWPGLPYARPLFRLP